MTAISDLFSFVAMMIAVIDPANPSYLLCLTSPAVSSHPTKRTLCSPQLAPVPVLFNSSSHPSKMAFVNVGGSSFTASTAARSALAPATSQTRPVVLRGEATTQRRSPTMAFSSIDPPERPVCLADMSVETKSETVYALYRHVFGNAYLMESERAELATAESDFLVGRSNTREFVRAMAKSNSYQKRFFAKSGPYRFVELNCKHLLGRGPRDQAEISFHVQKLMNEGYEAEIDSYIDSEEYEERFGAIDVPRFIYKGTYPKNDDFNRMNVMRMHWSGCSTSTKHGSTAPGRPMSADLLMGHGSYVSGFTKVMKGLPGGFRPEAVVAQAPDASFPANPMAGLRMRIEVAPNLFQVVEIPPIVEPKEPEWKKEWAEELNPGRRLNGVFY